jgi:hypothetical protein
VNKPTRAMAMGLRSLKQRGESRDAAANGPRNKSLTSDTMPMKQPGGCPVLRVPNPRPIVILTEGWWRAPPTMSPPASCVAPHWPGPPSRFRAVTITLVKEVIDPDRHHLDVAVAGRKNIVSERWHDKVAWNGER